MTEPLQFIHLESNPADAALIYSTLRDAGIACQPTRAQTREDFLSALRQNGCSLVLADTSVPGFDGTAALALTRFPSRHALSLRLQRARRRFRH